MTARASVVATSAGTVDPLEEMLRRALGGERGALAALLLRLRPALLSAARRRLGERQPGGQRPSDLVQETCVLALRGFAHFRGETEAELRTWLQQILRNAITAALRRSSAEKRADQATAALPAVVRSPAQTPSAVVCGRQSFRRVIAALAKLPAPEREAVFLRLVRERSLPEISAALGRPEQATASLLKRGLDRLRKQLQPDAQKLRRADAARLDAAVLAYLRLCDRGQRPAREVFLQQHADCAAALAPLLCWLDDIQAALQDDR